MVKFSFGVLLIDLDNNIMIKLCDFKFVLKS